MTNLEYARTLYKTDMPLVEHVVKTYIDKKVGIDSPIWVKETAYDEWCEEEFDRVVWDRGRYEMTVGKQLNNTPLNLGIERKTGKKSQKQIKTQMKKWLDALADL